MMIIKDSVLNVGAEGHHPADLFVKILHPTCGWQWGKTLLLSLSDIILSS